MSRVGKSCISIPSGVSCVVDDFVFRVSGKLGKISVPLPPTVVVSVSAESVSVLPSSDDRHARMCWGTYNRLIGSGIKGVSEGFDVKLEMEGVGYKASVSGSTLKLQLGYSHDIDYAIPEGIKIVCEKPTLLVISGIDKQKVGQIAAEIRALRKPEPYKGKGIRYAGEFIRRKEGKKK